MAQRRADARQQLHGAKGLGEVIIRTKIQCAGLVVLGHAGRNDNDGNTAPFADALNDANAIHIGQAQVQQDAIGTVGGRQRQRRAAIPHGDGIIARIAQGALQVVPDAGVILYDHDLITVFHPSVSSSFSWSGRQPQAYPRSTLGAVFGGHAAAVCFYDGAA